MGITYIILAVAVATCFITQNKKIHNLLLFFTCASAVAQNIISFTGIALLSIFYFITYLYHKQKTQNKFIKGSIYILVLIMLIAFVIHKLPGFKNQLVIKNTKISSNAVPFSMSLNFDAVIACIIFFINSRLSKQEQMFSTLKLKVVCKLLLIGIITIIPIGIFQHQIELDIKIPHILGIWIINNLFFVSFSEELLFRGIIQNDIKKAIVAKTNTLIPIILSGIVFGIAHFKGGITYIVMASISGILYGIAYDKTKSILSAILLHFLLNMIHLIYFTYPMLAK